LDYQSLLKELLTQPPDKIRDILSSMNDSSIFTATDKNGRTLLMLIAADGNPKRLRVLADFLFGEIKPDDLPESATDLGDLNRALDRIIDNSSRIIPDINMTDYSGKTAFHYAVESGCPHCVNILAAYGADPNQEDFTGRRYSIPGKPDMITVSVFSRHTIWYLYYLIDQMALDEAELFFQNEVDSDLKDESNINDLGSFLALFPALGQSDLGIDLETDDFSKYPDALELFRDLSDRDCLYSHPVIDDGDLLTIKVNEKVFYDEKTISDIPMTKGISSLSFNPQNLDRYALNEDDDEEYWKESLTDMLESDSGFRRFDDSVLNHKIHAEILRESKQSGKVRLLVDVRNSEQINWTFESEKFSFEKLAFIGNSEMSNCYGPGYFAYDVIYDGSNGECNSDVHMERSITVTWGKNAWPID